MIAEVCAPKCLEERFKAWVLTLVETLVLIPQRRTFNVFKH